MTGQTAPLFERLIEAGNPRDLDDWEGRDGYYVGACRISVEDVPGLIGIVRQWSDPDWPGQEEPQVDQENTELLPVTAWRALADLKADAAAQPLVDMLGELDDEMDDWVSEELPHVFGKIGAASIEPLRRVAADDGKLDFIRSVAARGLRCVADYHPPERDRIVAVLTEMMSRALEGHVRFCTTLLTELVDLHAVEAAESIERAFAADLLDVGMMGNWEQVRRKLGVEGLGLKMPDKPHNSIEQLRRTMGMGIFSDQALYTFGEIDHDAQQAYYQRTHDAFSKSSEAQQAIERYGNLGWFQTLLQFGLDYLGESVDQMTVGSVREFALDYVPRKVSVAADAAGQIVGELTLFWTYLDRVYQLPEAKAVVEWLKSDDVLAQMEAGLSDSANFGMAKSIFMSGQNAGYDMTSEAGLAEFMQVYNRSLVVNQPPTSRDGPIYRAGRNDPCPCGSGKKFKKCCASRRG